MKTYTVTIELDPRDLQAIAKFYQPERPQPWFAGPETVARFVRAEVDEALRILHRQS